MLLLGTLRLENFVQQHAAARIPMAAWQLEAEEANWKSADDVLERYADAEAEEGRLRFSIKGIYKLDVKAGFKEGILLVERVWTESVRKPLARKIARSKA
ncbi:type II toxin-antitoxin system HigB family toxin [uncultured Ramlibacter sp.]|uniref:type II toxin-antitoxin system HigB family toxin n=1 Tax=uncultured Ramlibacter sp. TaxID=260755 RepID=UPI002633940F|nr:type II toxin-antitoxin system HigB family toxin [uncultured Ramlibacter sp.]